MRKVVVHGEPDGAFFWAQGAPDPRLRPFVRSYGDFHERTTAPLMRREIASPELVVIIDLGDGWTVGQGETPPVRMGSFAGGLHDGPALAGHDGRARCLQLDLTPLGVRALLGVPPSEISHRIVALEDLLGRRAETLADRLEGAGAWPARFALLDELLLGAARETPPLRPDVDWAWRRLVQSEGALRIDRLTGELGCSRRHLATRFREQIGLTPKAFARVLRFQRGARLLALPGASAAEVAAACGYADQPHFTRDFRALAGTTPTAFLADRIGAAGVAA